MRPGNNGKSKMAEWAKRPTSAKNNGNHISFLPSRMLLKCSEGTSETFPDPRSKKEIH